MASAGAPALPRTGRPRPPSTTVGTPLQVQQGTTVIENRLTGLGLDALYARTRGGVTETYLTDALGSTVELRDGTQSKTVDYSYDPYGGTAPSGPSTNLAKYTAREHDLSDLYYYRNRY